MKINILHCGSAHALLAAFVVATVSPAAFSQSVDKTDNESCSELQRQTAPAFVSAQAAIDAAGVLLLANHDDRAAMIQKGCALDQIGEIKEVTGDYDSSLSYFTEAVCLFDRALATTQDNSIVLQKAAALRNLGRLCQAQHKSDRSSALLKRSFELYQQILRASPGDTAALVGLAKTQSQIADLQSNCFEKSWAFRNFESAHSGLDAVLVLQPKNIAALNAKACTYVMQSKLFARTKGRKDGHMAIESALMLYQRALKTDACNRDALNGIAEAYMTDGENRAQQQMFEFMARGAIPRYLKNHRKRNVIAEAAQSYRLCLDACDRALSTFPLDLQLLWLRADAGERLSDSLAGGSPLAVRGYTAAIASVNSLLERTSAAHTLCSKKSELLRSRARRQSDPATAASDYALAAEAEADALKLEPTDNYGKWRLIDSLLKEGLEWSKTKNCQRSRAAFDEALEAASLFAGSDEKSSSSYWQKTAEEQKARIYVELARCDASLGKYSSAVESISRAITIFRARAGTAHYANALGLSEGLALWAKARWLVELNQRQASLETYSEATRVFNSCMKKQPAKVVARYGHGDLIVDAEALRAKMSQGARKPITYEQAKQAIEKHVYWSD